MKVSIHENQTPIICSLGEELVKLSIEIAREGFGLLSHLCWKPSAGLSLKYHIPEQTDIVALGFELNCQ